MTRSDFDNQVKSLKAQQEQALATFHKATGALQFAEWLATQLTFEPEEKVEESNGGA